MFVVTLRFADKNKAGALMAGHNAWLQQGFDDGVFLVSGSLKSGGGGAILAHGTTLPLLQQRLNEDPFVSEGVVSADVVEIAPAKADERLGFLL